MNILCVEQDRNRLRQLRRDAKKIAPGARIIVCSNPCKAVSMARDKGCDELLTGTYFDGLYLDGIMRKRPVFWLIMIDIFLGRDDNKRKVPAVLYFERSAGFLGVYIITGRIRIWYLDHSSRY